MKHTEHPRRAHPFPGHRTTADGAHAAVHVETHIDQAAIAYPITPSTPMGQGFEEAVAGGLANLWGEPLAFFEPESEHSSASACEGFAAAGGRVTNFTSGQGLILMKEVLYTIAGKRLPVVFHIGARALTSQSLNVHAGHDDVMGVADVGWGMLFARNAQEVADLALIARRAAEDSVTPFFVVQDGFLTTHTLETLLLPEPELMKRFVEAPAEKLAAVVDPERATMSGVVQNQDSYMKGKVAQRFYYADVPDALRAALDEYFELTGRRYGMVDAYRMEDAEYALVAMGSAAETAAAAADYLRGEGQRVGVLHVTAFRPFPAVEVVEALRDVKAFAVLERLDTPLAQSNPLTAEIKAAFADALSGAAGYPAVGRMPEVYSGVGGLGSADVRAGDFLAIVKRMQEGGERFFAVGIRHPAALTVEESPDVRPEGAFSMRGHSIGGYGSITTNKVIASVASDLFHVNVQAYPKYGSEKKGLPTSYYLTLAPRRIRIHCELDRVEFVAVHDVNALRGNGPLSGLVDGGTLYLQTDQRRPEDVWASIPEHARRVIREHRIRLLALDAVGIAKDVSTRPDLVQRMQGIVLLGIFLRATPFAQKRGLRRDDLLKRVETALRRYFGRRGEQVIRDNMECVRRGYDEVFEVPRAIIEGRRAVAAA